jgi:hypothetical protein
MVPEDLARRTATRGERELFQRLREALADRSDIIVWHGVHVCGVEIDLVVFVPELGIIVIEVKDWSLDAVTTAGPDEWTAVLNDHVETHTSPYSQARSGSQAVRNAMRGYDALCHQNGLYAGRPVLPVAYAVAWPNISSVAADASPHSAHLVRSQTIFADDLILIRAGACEETLDLLYGLFSVWFDPPVLSAEGLDAIECGVFETTRITVSSPGNEVRRVGVLELDRMHARFARAIPSGPRLLKGGPGSGKTLTLVQHAVYRARFDPHAGRILFTCFNLALNGLVRDLIRQNCEPDRVGRIHVKAVYELCGAVLSTRVDHDSRETSYYEQLAHSAAEAVAEVPDWERYDVVLADEGQDLSPDMLRVVIGMLREGSRDIVIAEDRSQDLYGKRPAGFSYSEFKLDLRGRVTTIPAVYRCTEEIMEFAYRIARKSPPPDIDDETGQLVIQPEVLRSGGSVEEQKFTDRLAAVRYVVDGVKDLLFKQVPAAEIGILYTRELMPDGARVGVPMPLIESLCVALEAACVPFRWFSRNSASKLTFDLQEDRVKLGSVHGAKGLDFEHVFLIDALGCDNSHEDRSHLNLLFVGATRARDGLTFISIG